MARPDRDAVIDLLERMGRAMRQRGDHHRTRAYLSAANAVQRSADFEDLYAAGRLQEMPGVGPAIEKKIVDFVERGQVPEWLDDPGAAPAVAKAKGGAITRARAAASKGASDWPEPPRGWKEGPFTDAPDLHCHTTWSDGTLTLEETVLFAKRLAMPAIGISDHSGSLRIARGLRPDEVRQQWAAIDRVQEKHPDILILKGTECDILRDGRLDHPEELLQEFDYVIGSLHSQLKLDKEAQTQRVLTALDCPYLTVLGHPTTRVPKRRPRANLDLEKVFEKAAMNEVALEVNGNPGRIDLDEELALQALQAGAHLSLASDGHSAWEMLALAAARLIADVAGAQQEDIVNYAVMERAAKKRGVKLPLAP